MSIKVSNLLKGALSSFRSVTKTSFPYLFFIQSIYYTSADFQKGKNRSNYFTHLFTTLFGSTVVPVLFFNETPGLPIYTFILK